MTNTTIAQPAKVRSAKVVTRLNQKRYLAAHTKGRAATILKIQLVGAAIDGGSTHAMLADDAVAALTANGATVNAASVRGEVGQYAAAWKLAKTCKVHANGDALYAARQLSNGSVPAKNRDEAFAGFAGDAEAFIALAATVKAEAKLAPKAAKVPTRDPLAVSEGDAVEDADDTPEEAESLVEEAARLIKQLAGIIGHATPEDKKAILANLKTALTAK
jgi:hypothetical protein